MLMVKTKARQQKQSLNGSTMLGVSPVKKEKRLRLVTQQNNKIQDLKAALASKAGVA